LNGSEESSLVKSAVLSSVLATFFIWLIELTFNPTFAVGGPSMMLLRLLLREFIYSGLVALVIGLASNNVKKWPKVLQAGLTGLIVTLEYISIDVLINGAGSAYFTPTMVSVINWLTPLLIALFSSLFMFYRHNIFRE